MVDANSRVPRWRARSYRFACAVAIGVLISACAPPAQPVGDGGASTAHVALPIVAPTDATLDVGRSGPGLDDGMHFYAFTSALAPAATRSAYAADLVAAGFVEGSERDGWILFSRGSERLQVQVGSSGPPTSLVVRVMTEDSTPTSVAVEPSTGVAPSDETVRPIGVPDPPHPTAMATPRPGAATAGNGNGNGAGAGNGNGNGNGNGAGAGNGNGNGNGNGAGAGNGNGNGNGNGSGAGNGNGAGAGNGNGNGGGTDNGQGNGNGNGNGNGGETDNGQGNGNGGGKPEPTTSPKPTKSPKPSPPKGPPGGGG